MKVTRPQRILIVIYDAQSEVMRGALAARGFAVTAAPDYDSAYHQLLEARFDLVVIDLVEVAEGVEFIKRLRATTNLTQPLLLAIAEWGTGAGAFALTRGANAYEPKPLDAARLLDSVERLLGKKALSARERWEQNERKRFIQRETGNEESHLYLPALPRARRV